MARRPRRARCVGNATLLRPTAATGRGQVNTRKNCDDAKPAIGGSSRSVFLVLVEFADVMLGVELEPELGDQVELGFEEIDVLFLVVHQFLE
jgi:hypothetical protein